MELGSTCSVGKYMELGSTCELGSTRELGSTCHRKVLRKGRTNIEFANISEVCVAEFCYASLAIQARVCLCAMCKQPTTPDVLYHTSFTIRPVICHTHY